MVSLKVIALGLLTVVSASPSDLFRRTFDTPGVSAPQCSYPAAQGYTYLGCYSDNNRDRAIPGAYFANGQDNSPEWCAANCAAGGYKYFGVEYGSECFCGNALLSSQLRGNLHADFECNFPCPANRQLPCGGNDRINVYKLSS